MNNIKTLADQLRNRMAAPDIPDAGVVCSSVNKQNAAINRGHSLVKEPKIMEELSNYDNSGHKHLIHVRFDEKTAQMLSHFKMATGTDITKVVSFAVHDLFKRHPDLKTIIKQFISKIDL